MTATNLPTWKECKLRMDNKDFIEGNEDSYIALLPNPIHEFIYEYDDADKTASAQFLHKLEKVIDFVKSEQLTKIEELEKENKRLDDELKSLCTPF